MLPATLHLKRLWLKAERRRSISLMLGVMPPMPRNNAYVGQHLPQ